MTIKEIMAYVDDIKPNAFSNRQKTVWLNEVEGMVQTDVMLLAPSTVVTYVYEALWSGPGIAFPDSATMVFPASPQFRAGGTVTITGLLDYADNQRTDVKIKSISADGKTLCFEEGTFSAWGDQAETATATVTFDGSNSEPLIAPPHHKIYYTYLMAMIDFANGEYGKYQNTMTLFNNFFGGFTKWYVENYHPGDGKCLKKGYYLSAYAIAVKHGFCGTEEDFLSFLKGEKGEAGNGIRGIAKSDGTGAPGTTDTYTITMTDGATSTFTVYNGKDPDVSGKVDKVMAANLITNGDFLGGVAGWTTVYGTGSVTDRIYTLTLSGQEARGGVLTSSNLSPFPSAGEQFYFRVLQRVTSDDVSSLSIEIYKTGVNQIIQSISNPAKDIWHTLSGVATIPAAIGSVARLSAYTYYATKEIAAGKTTELKYAFSMNLTKTFGAGNEPTTAQMDALLSTFPDSWFNGTVDLTSITTLYDLIEAGKITIDSTLSALSTNPVQNSVIKASLDSKADLVDGLIPGAQLPSYVDDVIEASNFAALPTTGESGKIYVTVNDNKTWRWSGSAYVEISASIALGETAATAYRGDRGKTAYDHSQTGGNPHGTTASQVNIADADGYYTTDTVESALQQIGSELNGLAAHPVGSIYLSVNSTSPATLFGGTWAQLKDRFLLGAGDVYANGNTGGEASHALTEGETPWWRTSNEASGYSLGNAGAFANRVAISRGSVDAHNNMPPYLVVYIWQRTA